MARGVGAAAQRARSWTRPHPINMDWLLLGGAYLVGGVPFALLLARRVGGVDVRSAGSGNVGTANVLRATRPVLACAVLALDVGKGAAVALLTVGVESSDATQAAAPPLPSWGMCGQSGSDSVAGRGSRPPAAHSPSWRRRRPRLPRRCSLSWSRSHAMSRWRQSSRRSRCRSRSTARMGHRSRSRVPSQSPRSSFAVTARTSRGCSPGQSAVSN